MMAEAAGKRSGGAVVGMIQVLLAAVPWLVFMLAAAACTVSGQVALRMATRCQAFTLSGLRKIRGG